MGITAPNPDVLPMEEFAAPHIIAKEIAAVEAVLIMDNAFVDHREIR